MDGVFIITSVISLISDSQGCQETQNKSQQTYTLSHSSSRAFLLLTRKLSGKEG